MRILITGGLGFLGGRLAQQLSLTTGRKILLGTRREGCTANWLPGARVVQMDWSSSRAIAAACANVDVIVHLAGLSARACAANPVAAFRVNAMNTVRLVRAAALRDTRLIYLSTAHVYGSPLEGVITEATCPNPLSPYATSHRAAEDVVRGARARSEITGVVLRLSNAYGAPAHSCSECWSLLVNNLCRQAAATGRLALQSSGCQRRDFITLRDACRAIEHFLEPGVTDPADGLVNVGGRWAPTVWEMACRIQERCEVVLGVRPPMTRGMTRPGDAPAELDYRVDLLTATGFRLIGDVNGEVDRLLELCRTTFLPTR